MLLAEYSCGRLRAVLAEISLLEESEFPYSHSEDALVRIRSLFENHLKTLEKLPSDKNPNIVKGLCAEALADLFTYLPLLGFILRSTNVRNAFEVYGPLLRLAKQVLRVDTKLILSSEWRNYSPFTYRGISALPNFVLIGFPAPESANPLVLPLAGHELGHTVWRLNVSLTEYKRRVEENIIANIESRITEYTDLYPTHGLTLGDATSNIFVRQTIAIPSAWALKQAEEYFCDFLGLYLFDQAYLHAFAYLVAPSPAGERSVLYPNFKNRITKLLAAADRFRLSAPESYNLPPGYGDLFKDQTEPSEKERAKKFLLSLADSASGAIAGQLMDKVTELATEVNLIPMALHEKQRVLDTFRFVVPATKSSLPAIVNAAWEVYHSQTFWDNIMLESKEKTLKELVLKNIEVLEIEAITGG